MGVWILYTVYHCDTGPLALCMQITRTHFTFTMLTFWFMYVVYVFDFVVFFGSEIVGILTVGERGVAILQRIGGEGADGVLLFFQLSHCFCWIFLDGNQVRIRPACSPFTFFSPSSLSQLCPLTQVILL